MAHITNPRAALILASASPRRRELLERVGIAVEVIPADVDESPLADESAVDHARRLAGDKAAHIAAVHTGRWVLAADTVVEIDGVILGKPVDADEARSMLSALLGRTHRVTTGYALVGDDRLVDHVTTEVSMRAAGAGELDGYLAAGEWRGKAGAYAVQGMAAALVDAVHGSITNVIGLPLSEVVGALVRLGAAAPDYRQGQPA